MRQKKDDEKTKKKKKKGSKSHAKKKHNVSQEGKKRKEEKRKRYSISRFLNNLTRRGSAKPVTSQQGTYRHPRHAPETRRGTGTRGTGEMPSLKRPGGRTCNGAAECVWDFGRDRSKRLLCFWCLYAHEGRGNDSCKSGNDRQSVCT